MSVPAVTQLAEKLIWDVITTWAKRQDTVSGAGVPVVDQQYWKDGWWHVDDSATQIPAYSQGGPASACAVLWRHAAAADPNRPYHKAIAEQTLDAAAAPGGKTLLGYGGTGPTDGISTMMFMQELGVALLMLKDVSDPTKVATWTGMLRQGADALIAQGHPKWYSNGNINLGYSLALYLTWRVTQEPTYATAYRDALAFALAPTVPKWDGCGLIEERPNSWHDPIDGRAYLTESGGFDAEYTQVQLDILVRLALLAGDAPVEYTDQRGSLRSTTLPDLANKLLNTLLPRVSSVYWSIDTSYGSRHLGPGRSALLGSAALNALTDLGVRHFKPAVLESQFAAVDSMYRSTPILLRSSVNWYKMLGGQVGTILLSSLVQRGDVEQVQP